MNDANLAADTAELRCFAGVQNEELYLCGLGEGVATACKIYETLLAEPQVKPIDIPPGEFLSALWLALSLLLAWLSASLSALSSELGITFGRAWRYAARHLAHEDSVDRCRICYGVEGILIAPCLSLIHI